MKNENIKNKLSILRTKKYINKLKGIQVISLSLDKPKNIDWYSDELNNIDYPKIPLYTLPNNIDIVKLSELLLNIMNLTDEFIMVINDTIPMYLLFKITKLVDFLTSYFEENKSIDAMLFFTKEKKVIDIFLGENDLEISIFNMLNNS